MKSLTLSHEEFSLIKSCMLLMFIQRVFERDSHILEDSGVLRTPDLYVELVNTGMDRTSILMSEVKHEFKKRGLVIHHIYQDNEGVYADFECRGTRDQLAIPWSPFRSEMLERMRAYLGLSTALTVTADQVPHQEEQPSSGSAPRNLYGRHGRKRLVSSRQKPFRSPAYAAGGKV
ncbi:hypothetical protein Q5741_06040 [Paenibacillus sp. JX-17]|uniref:Uncharacterized protein n=1 Tax=Paenibacillus lacisoli TaxID=3064525 RepID=A0ABT9CBP6_9BACL|nr:hypothetical protein [Paenibacillus sp. JX-17]MDO7905978.1 hypothetical protein [Paenibacillus sp. JX-17]